MDMNQLVCFVTVAQTLNFSEAARRNYLSQSTVSRYIGELEKEFGVKLFTRTRRDVVITNEGKTLLPYAVDILSIFNKAKTVINELHEGGKGKITVGCDSTSMSFPSRCLADFGKRYPGIGIEIRQLDAADRAQAITGGDYDFCFMPRDMVPESSGIETLLTHSEPLVVVSAKKSRFKGKSLSLSELGEERLVLLSESSAPILFMEIMDLLRTFHISPHVDSSYDDMVSLYMAISSGMGVSILPIPSRSCSSTPCANTRSARMISMIYKRKKEQDFSCSFAIMLFMQCLKKVPYDQKERQCEEHQPDQQIAEHDGQVKA